MKKNQTLHVAIQEKYYNEQLHTLSELNFDVNAGEFLAIVGPSGSGKTTLLNLIAGLDKNVQGVIEHSTSNQQQNLAFMFQEPRLIPWLNVEDNIRLVIRAQAIDKHAQLEQRMRTLLQQVGLSDFQMAYPRQLSGGMQRRVALVRAFVIQPNLLLLDEPFQSLDEPNANQLRALLLQLWLETQTTILFVTHSLREALTLADRILFFSDRPARVALDYQVPLERPRTLNHSQVNQLHDSLLKEYPQLLSGNLHPLGD